MGLATALILFALLSLTTSTPTPTPTPTYDQHLSDETIKYIEKLKSVVSQIGNGGENGGHFQPKSSLTSDRDDEKFIQKLVDDMEHPDTNSHGAAKGLLEDDEKNLFNFDDFKGFTITYDSSEDKIFLDDSTSLSVHEILMISFIALALVGITLRCIACCIAVRNRRKNADGTLKVALIVVGVEKDEEHGGGLANSEPPQQNDMGLPPPYVKDV